MSIIDSRSVTIEIATLSKNCSPELQLNYLGNIYNLVQAFSDRQLDRAQGKLQQLINCDSVPFDRSRYVLVRENRYYSLWELAIDRAQRERIEASTIFNARSSILALQQAVCWFFQELWWQWQELLGNQQLQILAEYLFTSTPQLQTQGDIDRLLNIDPLTSELWAKWTRADLISFVKNLEWFARKKMGEQFATKLTIEIAQSLPEPLCSILTEILEISGKYLQT